MKVGRLTLRVIALTGAMMFYGIVGSSAQTLPSSLSSGMIDQLENQLNPDQMGNPAQPSPSPLDQARSPGYAGYQGQGNGQQYGGSYQRLPIPPAPPSPIETDYSHRAGTMLQQYGYDTFQNFRPSTGNLQAGAVADDYVLGIGDQLVITLRGQVSRSVTTRVDREGRIVIPNLPPIPAAGRSFADMRAALESQVSDSYAGTQVFVSLGAIRQISVAVLGEVKNPGVFQLGGFATALDALALAGGVKKTGTLRRILIVHPGGTATLDLYDVFNGGAAQNLSLQDGDRIVVRPVGPTVAVAGEVDRPGIYELSATDTISGAGLLALSGMPLRPSGNRYVKMRLDRNGSDETAELSAPGGALFRDGDILLVLHKRDLAIGSVQLDGHVRVPGIQSILEAPDLRSLIGSYDTFADDPYLLFAALETTDPQTLARKFVPVNLRRVLDGEDDIRLKSDDVLIVLGEDDIKYLSSADVQAVLIGQRPPILGPSARPSQSGLLQTSGASSLVPQTMSNQNTGYGSDTGAQQGYGNGSTGGNATGGGGSTGASASDNSNASAVDYLSSMAPSNNPTDQPSDTVLPYADRPVGQQQQQQPGGFPLQQSQDGMGLQGFQGSKPRQVQICRGLQSLAALTASGQIGRFANAIQNVTSKFDRQAPSLPNLLPCPKIFDRYPDLLPFVIEYAAAIHGEVHEPGIYPITTGTSLRNLVTTAGGLTRNVDLNAVELTHYGDDNTVAAEPAQREMLQLATVDLDRVLLAPGDVIRFNPVFTDRDDGPVVLSGEFLRPGIYDIRRGEHLSEVMARAGGLTPQAYPYGAVFTRESVKASEQVAAERAAQELQSGMLAALAHSGSQNASAQAEAPILQNFIAEIRNTPPIGRVVIEADPTVLVAKPELDMLLEPGDSLTMPKRPSYVTVSGQVLNPSTLQFTAGATAKDYIHEAGDYTQAAQKGRTFIILPNGTSLPVRTSFWNFSHTNIPPGSTVYVPRDVSGYDLLGVATDLSQVFGQIAITAASLAVIGRNN
jgi:polysaccharide export outer membrane protein